MEGKRINCDDGVERSLEEALRTGKKNRKPPIMATFGVE